MSAVSPTYPLHADPSGLRPRLLGYVRLTRPANLVTAAADILAAAVITAAPARIFLWLVAASVCLYAGGVVLNDFFDRDLDARERPERPIPAGVIAAPGVAILGVSLLAAGVCLACATSRISGIIAALTAGTVLFYDAWAKRHALGPMAMGCCRALNLLLGISAVPALLSHLWFFALIPLLYIVAVTTLSRGEVHGGSRATSGLTLLLVCLVLLAVIVLPPVAGAAHWLALLPFAVFFSTRVGPPLWRAYQLPDANRIRAGVHAGVISLIVLDAALAAGFGGVVVGAAVLSLSVISAELARFFAVT